jgi:hypothetical protein
VTEQELLDMVRENTTERTSKASEGRKRTARRCRDCFVENEDWTRDTCASCGRELSVRARPGKVVSCPESGDTDGSSCFVVKIAEHRCALLGPGGTLVLGRGENVDVWLEGKTVSRHHVEIAWDEGAAHPRFRDLGSANGTRHRGLLRAEGLLGTGDSLEIGPYRITLEREERAPTRGSVEAAFDPGPELHGPIGKGTTSVLLRGLAAAGRTGTFEVAFDEATGSVVLAGGRVVSAECGKTIGLAALHVILSADSGAYRFLRTFEVDDGEAVDLTVEEILATVPV